MRIFTRFLSMLMVLLSILLFISQARSQVANLPRISSTSFPRVNEGITSPPRYSSESPDSCDLKIYIEDDSIANDAYSCPPGWADSLCRIGNLFPDTGKSGTIQSMDMYFSQYGSSSGISTIVYIYAADQHTILGQSAPFTPTAATWPSGTWCHATFSNVPYNGEFYALVDMFPYDSNMENYFNVDMTTPQPPGYPWGLGWSDIDGTWTLMVNSSICTGPTSVTFLQRANVCENVVVGIKKLTPESISIYPNPATDKITIELSGMTQSGNLAIVNMEGQQLVTRQITKLKTQIDISSLPSGVYCVRLTNDKTVEVGKFIKK